MVLLQVVAAPGLDAGRGWPERADPDGRNVWTETVWRRYSINEGQECTLVSIL